VKPVQVEEDAGPAATPKELLKKESNTAIFQALRTCEGYGYLGFYRLFQCAF